MKVKPKDNYELYGTNVKLSSRHWYNATAASNVPDPKNRGLVFVKGILLDNTEYTTKQQSLTKPTI